jgi:hypothetical protein
MVGHIQDSEGISCCTPSESPVTTFHPASLVCCNICNRKSVWRHFYYVLWKVHSKAQKSNSSAKESWEEALLKRRENLTLR